MSFARTLVCLGLAITAAGQDPPAPVQEPSFVKALQTWIESDHADRGKLDAAAAALVEGGAPGLRVLADALRATSPDDRDRRVAVETLLSSTVLEFVGRAQNAGMRFAGQYDDLRILQPYSGRFLMGLLLDTPGWFPSDQRAALVPALRDIFDKAPEAATLDRITKIASDEDFESESLREALSFALAQWGRRDLVQTRIAELNRSAGARKTADELHFVRALAKLHYDLRDYPLAASWWDRYAAGIKALEDHVSALDEYDFACCHALAGRSDDALAALERCAGLVADGKVDSSVEITAKMFDEDPDLRSIRAQARFAAAREKAFGKRKSDKEGSGR